MGRYRTILLRADRGREEEGVLDTAAQPGMNIVLASDGKYDPGAGVASASQINIVTESYNALNQGKTVDDTIAIGDRASFITPIPGERYAILLKNAEAASVGSLLKADSAGLFVVTASAPAQFVAREALTASGNQLIEAKAL
jgi:hypothetical protein